MLPDQKQKMSKAKKRIQKEFWVEVGLIVDVPQHGSGTSNNGNTARKFFQDPELTSSITRVDKVLIEKFGIILQAMTSGKRIDFIKFEEYCEETAKLYVSLYEWFKMPVAVHKVLIHGAKVIENASLPIGQLTEEAQEVNNKIFKSFTIRFFPYEITYFENYSNGIVNINRKCCSMQVYFVGVSFLRIK